MTTPFVFSFNIRRSLYQQVGTSLFKRLPPNIILLPIVNNLDHGVETRAKQISRNLPEILAQNRAKKCHLISYSLSGIDSRFAISQFETHKYVSTLTTIATPHLGSRLAWLAEKQVISDKKSQPIARLLGVGLRPFYDTTQENMRYFNSRVKDVASVKYYSIGAERLPNNMNPNLRQTGNYLRNKTIENFIYENDGVVGHDQCQWGQHLVNFQADHTQIVGLTPYDQLQAVFRLIQDNVAIHQQENQ